MSSPVAFRIARHLWRRMESGKVRQFDVFLPRGRRRRRREGVLLLQWVARAPYDAIMMPIVTTAMIAMVVKSFFSTP